MMSRKGMVLFDHDHDVIERGLLRLQTADDANCQQEREIEMFFHRYFTP